MSDIELLGDSDGLVERVSDDVRVSLQDCVRTSVLEADNDNRRVREYELDLEKLKLSLGVNESEIVPVSDNVFEPEGVGDKEIS